MEYVTLGKTGLRVSVAGLGCGGNSRLGLGRGKTEAEAIALVRQALDLGLNLLDTASAYGTEALIGKAIKTVPRDCVVITTKALMNRGSTPSRPCGSWRASSALCVSSTPTTLTYSNCRLSCRRCMTTRSRPSPLLREKEKEKVRALGITETSPNDHEQCITWCGAGTPRSSPCITLLSRIIHESQTRPWDSLPNVL